MANIFGASEVFEFAIRIEENGETFYREVSQKIKQKELKSLFNFLADEETKHRSIFKEMLSQIENYQPPESYPGEYFAYLKAYADEHIFTKDKKGSLMAKRIKTAKEAIEFAIGIELDSILYYLEAKNLVPEYQKRAIDKIIEEERSHYLRLHRIKKGA
ncbi:MAG: ferritin family protein [Candidatus Omnitrophica bacterium]|nr:ferritin family protein [Candidatus Omnitrophota bacterium]